jgi:hypothetical protein
MCACCSPCCVRSWCSRTDDDDDDDDDHSSSGAVTFLELSGLPRLTAASGGRTPLRRRTLVVADMTICRRRRLYPVATTSCDSGERSSTSSLTLGTPISVSVRSYTQKTHHMFDVALFACDDKAGTDHERSVVERTLASPRPVEKAVVVNCLPVCRANLYHGALVPRGIIHVVPLAWSACMVQSSRSFCFVHVFVQH